MNWACVIVPCSSCVHVCCIALHLQCARKQCVSWMGWQALSLCVVCFAQCLTKVLCVYVRVLCVQQCSVDSTTQHDVCRTYLYMSLNMSLTCAGCMMRTRRVEPPFHGRARWSQLCPFSFLYLIHLGIHVSESKSSESLAHSHAGHNQRVSTAWQCGV